MEGRQAQPLRALPSQPHQETALPIPGHVERLAHNRQGRDTRASPAPPRKERARCPVQIHHHLPERKEVETDDTMQID